MTNWNKIFSLLFVLSITFTVSFCSKKEEVPQTRIISLSGDLSFGSIEVGKTLTKTFTINNSGNLPLAVTNLTLPAKFTGTFSGTIVAGSSQNVSVTFAPDIAGTFNGSIVVNANQTSGTNTISVSGAATQPLVKAISLAGDLNFGTVTIGETSQKLLTINNTGTALLTITGLTLPAGFTGTFSGTIAVGASQIVMLTFTPTQAITYSGTVTVNGDQASGTNTIAIAGIGTQAPTRIISLNPSSLDFGSLEVNKTSQKTFTIKNTGNAAMTVSGLTLPNGYTANYNGGTIAADASVDVIVTFSPTATGTFNGTITISANANSGMTTLAVTGTASAVPTRIIALSGDLSFGNIEVGKTSIKTFTIANTGNSALTISSLTLPTGFSGTFSGTLQAGATQNVSITFAPTQATNYTGNITVNANQTAGTTTIAVSGTGSLAVVTDALAVYKKIYGASEIYEEGNFIVIKTNGRPDHKSPYYTGTAWAATLYEAYNGTNTAWSQNPNKIAAFSYTFKIPKNPTSAATKSATPLGAIGVSLNGVPFYNQYAGPNNQALTSEINSFDQYYGHPQQQGAYHYHIEPLWLTAQKGKDVLLGFLLDGFPVYGPIENGKAVTNSDLDAYHGHTHATTDYPNGIYHYHITSTDPYINGSGFYGTAGTVSQ
ncbi:MAG: choice-of-anchor D domain-containing protein [Cytophagales bacterium]|nr:MAG: choice-of-anchor D domain-containing protein [Cytophagales bacterium]